jgi:hypothetical protein
MSATAIAVLNFEKTPEQKLLDVGWTVDHAGLWHHSWYPRTRFTLGAAMNDYESMRMAREIVDGTNGSAA